MSRATTDSAKLHELLKTAARELKAVQQELLDERDLHEQARKSLDQERTRARELERTLNDTQHALKSLQQQLKDVQEDAVTAAVPRELLGDVLPRTGPNAEPGSRKFDRLVTSRVDVEAMESRVQQLERALVDAENEVRAYKQRSASLEAQVAALKELAPHSADALDVSQASLAPENSLEPTVTRAAEPDASQDPSQTLAAVFESELEDERQKNTQVKAKYHALEAELAIVRKNAARASELDAQLTEANSKRAELEQQNAELEAKLAELAPQAESDRTKVVELTARTSQFEVELGLLRSRRDELNVELARVESDRKKVVARLADMDTQLQQAVAAVEAKRADLEGQLTKEKEKHQHTAHRLLESRQRTRELEQQLADVQQQVELVNAEQSLREAEAAKVLASERERLQASLAALQAQVADLEKDLAHATEEWHHTNRQYEQLHREMLILLDQRDEARRQLEVSKS